MDAHLTDALSGVFDGQSADGSGGSQPQIRFVGPSGQIVDGLFDIDTPLSGDIQDGTFRASITLSEFAEAGTWQVAYLLLNDEAGNAIVLDPQDSAPLAGTSFTVTNANGDAVAPELQSISIGEPAVDPITGNSTLTVTVHLTENISGIFDGEFADGTGGSSPQIRFVSSTGQSVDGLFDILNPVSGDLLDGVFEASITLGPFAEAGVWRIEYLLLSDEAGNQSSLDSSSSPLLFGGAFVLGSPTSDSLVGTSDDDIIHGYGGNDTLFAGNGDDVVFAGADNDVVIAGSGLGNDTYDGGTGIDTLRYTSASKGISANLATGVATGPQIGTDHFTGFENIQAGAGKDNLVGNSLANLLSGGASEDTLRGGDGADVLIGGLNRDVLSGGTGRDLFDFNSIKESKKGGQRDKIMDFKRGQDDIDLKDIDAQKGGGNQKFTWIGKKDFHDKKGELRYEDKGSKVVVQGDVNGDGKADFEIYVAVGSLSKGDFVL